MMEKSWLQELMVAEYIATTTRNQRMMDSGAQSNLPYRNTRTPDHALMLYTVKM